MNPCERSEYSVLLFRYVSFNGYGDLFFKFVDGNFNKNVWKNILLSEEHKEYVQNLKDQNRLSYFLHDHCMNGGKPTDTLDEVFGAGMYGNPPPPPCKFVTGTRKIQVKAGKNRKAHERTIKVKVPKKRCHCTLGCDEQAAKIPDCNRAENLFNHIENKLRKMGRTHGWPKNKEQLKERITSILNKTPKSWFKNTFASLPDSWKEVVKRRGNLSDYYVPKRRKTI